MNRLFKTAALVACLGLTTALAASVAEATKPEISSRNTNASVDVPENPVPASKLPPIKDYKTVPSGQLDVITAGYPRVIFFRSPTETAGQPGGEFEDYEYWKRTMLNLNGFVGKGLDEGVNEIRGDEEISTIKVENTEAFREKIGRGLAVNDDITICRLGKDGKPDWSYYEEVKLQ